MTFFSHLRPWGLFSSSPIPPIKLQSGIQSRLNGVALALFRILAITTRGIGTRERNSQLLSRSNWLPVPLLNFQGPCPPSAVLPSSSTDLPNWSTATQLNFQNTKASIPFRLASASRLFQTASLDFRPVSKRTRRLFR